MLGGDLPAGCRHGPPSPGTAAGCTPCCSHRQHLSFPGTLQSKGSSKTGIITTSLWHWHRFWHTINTIGLSGKNTEMATTVLCMFSSATNLNLQKFSLLVSIFFFPLTSVFAIGWALTGPSAGKTAAGQRHPWQLPPPGHITSEHSVLLLFEYVKIPNSMDYHCQNGCTALLHVPVTDEKLTVIWQWMLLKKINLLRSRNPERSQKKIKMRFQLFRSLSLHTILGLV